MVMVSEPLLVSLDLWAFDATALLQNPAAALARGAPVPLQTLQSFPLLPTQWLLHFCGAQAAMFAAADNVTQLSVWRSLEAIASTPPSSQAGALTYTTPLALLVSAASVTWTFTGRPANASALRAASLAIAPHVYSVVGAALSTVIPAGVLRPGYVYRVDANASLSARWSYDATVAPWSVPAGLPGLGFPGFKGLYDLRGARGVLLVAPSARSAFAYVHVPPVAGTFIVAPSEGVVFQTPFAMQTGSWLDVDATQLVPLSDTAAAEAQLTSIPHGIVATAALAQVAQGAQPPSVGNVTATYTAAEVMADTAACIDGAPGKLGWLFATALYAANSAIGLPLGAPAEAVCASAGAGALSLLRASVNASVLLLPAFSLSVSFFGVGDAPAGEFPLGLSLLANSSGVVPASAIAAVQTNLTTPLLWPGSPLSSTTVLNANRSTADLLTTIPLLNGVSPAAPVSTRVVLVAFAQDAWGAVGVALGEIWLVPLSVAVCGFQGCDKYAPGAALMVGYVASATAAVVQLPSLGSSTLVQAAGLSQLLGSSTAVLVIAGAPSGTNTSLSIAAQTAATLAGSLVSSVIAIATEKAVRVDLPNGTEIRPNVLAIPAVGVALDDAMLQQLGSAVTALMVAAPVNASLGGATRGDALSALAVGLQLATPDAAATVLLRVPPLLPGAAAASLDGISAVIAADVFAAASAASSTFATPMPNASTWPCLTSGATSPEAADAAAFTLACFSAASLRSALPNDAPVKVSSAQASASTRGAPSTSYCGPAITVTTARVSASGNAALRLAPALNSCLNSSATRGSERITQIPLALVNAQRAPACVLPKEAFTGAVDVMLVQFGYSPVNETRGHASAMWAPVIAPPPPVLDPTPGVVDVASSFSAPGGNSGSRRLGSLGDDTGVPPPRRAESALTTALSAATTMLTRSNNGGGPLPPDSAAAALAVAQASIPQPALVPDLLPERPLDSRVLSFSAFVAGTTHVALDVVLSPTAPLLVEVPIRDVSIVNWNAAAGATEGVDVGNSAIVGPTYSVKCPATPADVPVNRLFPALITAPPALVANLYAAAAAAVAARPPSAATTAANQSLAFAAAQRAAPAFVTVINASAVSFAGEATSISLPSVAVPDVASAVGGTPSKVTDTSSALAPQAAYAFVIAVDCGAVFGKQSFVCGPGTANVTVVYACPTAAAVPECLTWDTASQAWSGEGCTVVNSSATSVLCACTSFSPTAVRFATVARLGANVFSEPIPVVVVTPTSLSVVYIAAWGALVGLSIIVCCGAMVTDSLAAPTFVKALHGERELAALSALCDAAAPAALVLDRAAVSSWSRNAAITPVVDEAVALRHTLSPTSNAAVDGSDGLSHVLTQYGLAPTLLDSAVCAHGALPHEWQSGLLKAVAERTRDSAGGPLVPLPPAPSAAAAPDVLPPPLSLWRLARARAWLQQPLVHLALVYDPRLPRSTRSLVLLASTFVGWVAAGFAYLTLTPGYSRAQLLQPLLTLPALSVADTAAIAAVCAAASALAQGLLSASARAGPGAAYFKWRFPNLAREAVRRRAIEEATSALSFVVLQRTFRTALQAGVLGGVASGGERRVVQGRKGVDGGEEDNGSAGTTADVAGASGATEAAGSGAAAVAAAAAQGAAAPDHALNLSAAAAAVGSPRERDVENPATPTPAPHRADIVPASAVLVAGGSRRKTRDVVAAAAPAAPRPPRVPITSPVRLAAAVGEWRLLLLDVSDAFSAAMLGWVNAPLRVERSCGTCVRLCGRHHDQQSGMLVRAEAKLLARGNPERAVHRALSSFVTLKAGAFLPPPRPALLQAACGTVAIAAAVALLAILALWVAFAALLMGLLRGPAAATSLLFAVACGQAVLHGALYPAWSLARAAALLPLRARLVAAFSWLPPPSPKVDFLIPPALLAAIGHRAKASAGSDEDAAALAAVRQPALLCDALVLAEAAAQLAASAGLTLRGAEGLAGVLPSGALVAAAMLSSAHRDSPVRAFFAARQGVVAAAYAAALLRDCESADDAEERLAREAVKDAAHRAQLALEAEADAAERERAAAERMQRLAALRTEAGVREAEVLPAAAAAVEAAAAPVAPEPPPVEVAPATVVPPVAAVAPAIAAAAHVSAAVQTVPVPVTTAVQTDPEPDVPAVPRTVKVTAASPLPAPVAAELLHGHPSATTEEYAEPFPVPPVKGLFVKDVVLDKFAGFEDDVATPPSREGGRHRVVALTLPAEPPGRGWLSPDDEPTAPEELAFARAAGGEGHMLPPIPPRAATSAAAVSSPPPVQAASFTAPDAPLPRLSPALAATASPQRDPPFAAAPQPALHPPTRPPPVDGFDGLQSHLVVQQRVWLGADAPSLNHQAVLLQAMRRMRAFARMWRARKEAERAAAAAPPPDPIAAIAAETNPARRQELARAAIFGARAVSSASVPAAASLRRGALGGGRLALRRGGAAVLASRGGLPRAGPAAAPPAQPPTTS